MSGTGALRLLRATPAAMWTPEDPVTAPVPIDPLARARDMAGRAVEELAVLEDVLDRYDPSPEPGENLVTRLTRVLRVAHPDPTQEPR